MECCSSPAAPVGPNDGRRSRPTRILRQPAPQERLFRAIESRNLSIPQVRNGPIWYPDNVLPKAPLHSHGPGSVGGCRRHGAAARCPPPAAGCGADSADGQGSGAPAFPLLRMVSWTSAGGVDAAYLPAVHKETVPAMHAKQELTGVEDRSGLGEDRTGGPGHGQLHAHSHRADPHDSWRRYPHRLWETKHTVRGRKARHDRREHLCMEVDCISPTRCF